MTNFIKDNTAIPSKTSFQNRPEIPAAQKFTGDDWMLVRQHLLDTQSYLRTELDAISAATLGLVGDGVTVNTEATIQAAAATAVAAKRALWFPPGTYLLQRSGANAWCIDVNQSDLVIQGVRGQTVFKAQSGMPNASVPLMRIDDKSNVVIRDVVFDGNWGVSVCEVDAIAGDQDGTALAVATLPLKGDLSNFSASGGTAYVCFPDGSSTAVTYTGKDANGLTGCSGGSGTIHRGYRVASANTTTGVAPVVNHTAQTDPKNHALMIRGCRNVLVENCVFRNLYGDAIWLGISVDDDLYNWCRDIKIVDCDINVTARNAISFGAGCERVSIVRTRMDNYWTCGVDSEPQGYDTANRNIMLFNNFIRPWPTFPGGGFGQAIGVVAGTPSGFNHSSAARNWRIVDNEIYGWTAINNAIDVVMRGNHIEVHFEDPAGTPRTVAPIFIDHACDDITVSENWIYDNEEKSAASGDAHNAAIQIQSYNSGSTQLQPAGIRVFGNRIKARKGNHGIWVNAQGGFTFGDGTAVVAESSGSATGVTRNTLTNSGAAWTTNQWTGWRVIMDGKVALIASNTGTVLTLVTPDLPLSAQHAWVTPLGERTALPATGAYRITSNAGVLDIDGNHIDCGADGNTAGGHGVYLFNDRAGSRIRISNNAFKNVTSWGVFVVGAASKPILSLEIVDNKFWDDQATPSTSAAIRYTDAASLTSIVKLIMRGNALVGGISTMLSNVAAGKWLVNDGEPTHWAGFATPEGAVTAPVGSTFARKDGGAGTCFYVKESGTGNTGWVAK